MGHRSAACPSSEHSDSRHRRESAAWNLHPPLRSVTPFELGRANMTDEMTSRSRAAAAETFRSAPTIGRRLVPSLGRRRTAMAPMDRAPGAPSTAGSSRRAVDQNPICSPTATSRSGRLTAPSSSTCVRTAPRSRPRRSAPSHATRRTAMAPFLVLPDHVLKLQWKQAGPPRATVVGRANRLTLSRDAAPQRRRQPSPGRPEPAVRPRPTKQRRWRGSP